MTHGGMQRIWRYQVPVDGHEHSISLTGSVLHVAPIARTPYVVEFWAGVGQCAPTRRLFQAYGTDHDLPREHDYMGTTIDGPMVWHLLEHIRYAKMI